VPRDALGVVTLPVGNPVVAGTAISADVANATVTDLASMIEDSLSRSGKGGMNAPMQFADGAAATPSITFSSETDTGFSKSGAGLALSIGGAIKTLVGFVLSRFYNAVQMDSTLDVAGVITATSGVSGILVTNLPATNVASGTSTGGYTTTQVTYASDVTNSSLTLTTSASATARPVLLTFQPSGASAQAQLRMSTSTADVRYMWLRLVRNGTEISEWMWQNSVASASVWEFGANLSFLDLTAAANTTYTYVWQVRVDNADTTAGIINMISHGFEL
jgi:hypothetical protein